MAVPIERLGYPVGKIHPRCPAQDLLGLVDRERPILQEEVEPAPIERRFHPEGPTQILAKRSGNIDRGFRPAEPGRLNARFLRNKTQELSYGCIARSGQNKGLAGCFGQLGGSHETARHVLDVCQVVEDVTPPDKGKPSPCDTSKKLKKTPIAGSVDTNWSKNDRGQSPLTMKSEDYLFCFDLRLLVDVVGVVGRRLVRRRSYFPVDTARTAVEKRNASLRNGGLRQQTRTLDIDPPVITVIQLGFTIDGRYVKNSLATGNSLPETRWILKLALETLDVEPFEKLERTLSTNQRPYPMTRRSQKSRQVTTREPASPSDKNFQTILLEPITYIGVWT